MFALGIQPGAAPPLSLCLLLALLLSMAQPGHQLSRCGYCMCDRPTVSCDFDSAKSEIVNNIELTDYVPSSSLLRRLGRNPASYSELYVNCKNARVLKSQRLTSRLLEHFANLTRLSVLSCDLIAIDDGALSSLRQLRELDLSDNQLQRLPPAFLNGKSLTALRFGENRRLQLTADMFRGLQLDRLLLSRCGLSEFPLDSLNAIAGLRELTLSHNSIQTVPVEARDLINQLRVFYLDDNPLACTCQNRWLRNVDWNRVSPPLSKASPRDQLPRCATPQRLLNAELSSLGPTDLPCDPPRLVSIDLQLGPVSGRLACKADSDQPERLVWTYRQIAGYPEFQDGATYQGTGAAFVSTFKRSVMQQQPQPQYKYLLTTATDDGRQSNFTLSLQWPPLQRPPHQPDEQQPTAVLAGRTPSNGGPPLHSLPQPRPGDVVASASDSAAPDNSGNDYFSRKQFTLVEMIVAVIGTFLATALVFVLVCQFTRWYSKRDKKRWATYAAHPYSGYNYTSGSQQLQQQPTQYLTHRPPSHEYDVPRIESMQLQQQQQPMSPKMTHLNNCTADFEFVDYSGRRLYNRGNFFAKAPSSAAIYPRSLSDECACSSCSVESVAAVLHFSVPGLPRLGTNTRRARKVGWRSGGGRRPMIIDQDGRLQSKQGGFPTPSQPQPMLRAAPPLTLPVSSEEKKINQTGGYEFPRPLPTLPLASGESGGCFNKTGSSASISWS
uniref:LRRCT domain-containing protein n=1 Tax=Macrostomum lignano TaxID=282301 RepID=A0A1I8IUC4_9PLAT